MDELTPADKKKLYAKEYRERKKREASAARAAGIAPASPPLPCESPALAAAHPPPDAPVPRPKRIVVFAVPDYTQLLAHHARYARTMRELRRRTAFLTWAGDNDLVVSEFHDRFPAYAAHRGPPPPSPRGSPQPLAVENVWVELVDFGLESTLGGSHSAPVAVHLLETRLAPQGRGAKAQTRVRAPDAAALDAV